MSKISKEIAEQEVTAWLDKKKVLPSMRENSKDAIEIMIEAIQEGILVLNQDDFKFTHTLLFDFGNEVKITQLTYVPRLNDNMLKPHLVGVKPQDGDGRLLATLAALTGQQKAVLAHMDTADKKIATAIATFFF